MTTSSRNSLMTLVDGKGNLTTKSVQGTALAFQGIDDVHSSNGLPLGVFGVGDGISDDVLEEYLQHTTSFFINETGDTLDTTSSG